MVMVMGDVKYKAMGKWGGGCTYTDRISKKQRTNDLS